MIGIPRSELFAFQASIRVRRLHSSASVLLDSTNSKMFRFRKLELYGITVGNAQSPSQLNARLRNRKQNANWLLIGKTKFLS